MKFCLHLSSVCVCVCAGDAAVGKTALSHMFHSDGTLFQKNYSMVRALTRRKGSRFDPRCGYIMHSIMQFQIYHCVYGEHFP